VPIVFKSGRFNLLEPSGLVQVCNGIALPFTDGLTVGKITRVRSSPDHGVTASSNRERGACVMHAGISLCDGHRRDAGMKVESS
jgi:hypothetical protein